MKNRKITHRILSVLLTFAIVASLCSCAKVDSDFNDLNGSIGDNTIVANVVNKYKNAFGKPVVVVIQSQLGNPICAYSGKDVYWKVCEDLPKTTKLMIDDKALYIHRANFQIIDLALLNQ